MAGPGACAGPSLPAAEPAAALHYFNRMQHITPGVRRLQRPRLLASPFRNLSLVALALASFIWLGCATGAFKVGTSDEIRFGFFGEADPEINSWVPKVEQWQARARRDEPKTRPSLPQESSQHKADLSGELRRKMGAFQVDQRQALARKINDWAQDEARTHYRFDRDQRNPARDHWPTFAELLERNGDDCDGLDLIAYELLREFGFQPGEIYRAVVKRDSDGRNHMVTLWFEDRDDPWVLDATGAMSGIMRKFSQLPGWTPTVVFNAYERFGVTRLTLPVAGLRP